MQTVSRLQLIECPCLDLNTFLRVQIAIIMPFCRYKKARNSLEVDLKIIASSFNHRQIPGNSPGTRKDERKGEGKVLMGFGLIGYSPSELRPAVATHTNLSYRAGRQILSFDTLLLPSPSPAEGLVCIPRLWPREEH